MSWTTTPPTTPGSKYWRWNKSQKDYDIYRLYIIDGGKLRVTAMSPSEIGGEWWDSPVPAPGIAEKLERALKEIVVLLNSEGINDHTVKIAKTALATKGET